MEQKDLKNPSVLKIIAFESGSTNSHSPEEDTCHWQSITYQATLRFQLSIREIFSKSGSLRVLEKYDETPLMHI